MERLLAWSYLCCLGLLACYGVHRYHLVWLYYRVKARRATPPTGGASWPTVTIQIPVYNERYVVERAIRSACEVDYPHERLEIQLLDDSTDDTTEIIARAMAPYRQRGLAVSHVRRTDRQDFKAGALAEGLKRARGEFIAVFDVDFVIPPDFLKRTVPFFTDATVGMVQVRWGHLNADCSLLAQSQAILIDGHFAIEQVARHQSGRFFSFNGTAGIWRKAAILSAGGWQTDTLTEDLDLSYRAQLAGWRFVFLPDLVACAELPVEMNAFKTQQYRWTKGSIQTAKKLLLRVLHSPLPWPIKVEAFFHLSGFFIYPIGLLASLGFPPILMGLFHLPHSWYTDLTWFLLLAIPGACFYLCAQREIHPDWPKRMVLVLWVIAVGIGMSVNNTVAVLDALGGGDSEFIRTTKFGIHSKADRWAHKRYRAPQTTTAWLELALAAYFAFGFLVALNHGVYLALPSLALFCAGFGYVGWLSLSQRAPLQTPTRLLLQLARSRAPHRLPTSA